MRLPEDSGLLQREGEGVVSNRSFPDPGNDPFNGCRGCIPKEYKSQMQILGMDPFLKREFLPELLYLSLQ
ncbi:hypothetical protein D3C76_1711740 [compost metagenome]